MTVLLVDVGNSNICFGLSDLKEIKKTFWFFKFFKLYLLTQMFLSNDNENFLVAA